MIVKIVCEEKTFILKKGITNLKEVEQQVVARYPEKFEYGAQIYYKGELIENFNKFLDQNKQIKSVRLQAKKIQETKKAIKKQQEAKSEKSQNEQKVGSQTYVKQTSQIQQDQLQNNIQQNRIIQSKIMPDLSLIHVQDNNQQAQQFTLNESEIDDDDQQDVDQDQKIFYNTPGHGEQNIKQQNRQENDSQSYNTIRNKYADDVESGIIKNSTQFEVNTPQQKVQSDGNSNFEQCKMCQGAGKIEKNSDTYQNIEKIIEKIVSEKIRILEKSLDDRIAQKLLQSNKTSEKSEKSELLKEQKVLSESQNQTQNSIDMETQNRLRDPLSYINDKLQNDQNNDVLKDLELQLVQIDQVNEESISNQRSSADLDITELTEIRCDGQWVKVERKDINARNRKSQSQSLLLNLKSQLQQMNKKNNSSKEQNVFSFLKLLDDFSIKSHPGNCDTVDIGVDFKMQFEIKIHFFMPLDIPIWVIDQVSGDTKQISFRPNSIFQVGPYNVKSQGIFERKFNLYYIDENMQMQHFGPSFQFSIQVAKPIKQIMRRNGLKFKVSELLKQYSKTSKTVDEVLIILDSMKIKNQNELMIRQIIQNL